LAVEGTAVRFAGIKGVLRFVWYRSISHEDEILVGAAVHEVEAGLVAIQECEPAVVGQGGKRRRESREVGSGRLGLGSLLI